MVDDGLSTHDEEADAVLVEELDQDPQIGTEVLAGHRARRKRFTPA